jgi:aminodeoxyfutalosine synthase
VLFTHQNLILHVLVIQTFKMKPLHNLDILLNDALLDTDLKNIVKKVSNHQRISNDDALLLFEKASLSFLGTLANYIREHRHGDNTYFNRNFHIEPTNVCLYTCTFCSYSRLIKRRDEGWEFTHDEIMDIIRKYDHQPVTEVHIVGGVLPQYDVKF